MKNESRGAAILRCAGSVILILAAALCSVGALISAFIFPVEIKTLFIIFLIASLASGILATFFRAKGLIALIPPIAVVLILRFDEIISGAKWAIFFISQELSNWMQVPVFFENAVENDYDLTLFFAALGVVLIIFLSIAICLRRSASVTALLTAPLVIPTLILLEYPPDYWYIIGLLAVYFTMMLCSAAHPDNYIRRGNAVFPILALSIPLLALAYYLIPTEDYDQNDLISGFNLQVREFLHSSGIEMGGGPGLGWPRAILGQWRFDTNNVSISAAGSRNITGAELLEVISSASGIFYLRGYSMQKFDGSGWIVNSTNHGTLYYDSIIESTPALIARTYYSSYQNYVVTLEHMNITKIGDSTDIQYSPYYHVPDYYHVDNIFYKVNENVLLLESALRQINAWNGSWGDLPPPMYIDNIKETYLQINESTAQGLREIAAREGITENDDRASIVDGVAALVSSSSRYSLFPRPIPNDEDFALYFLETAHSGYCIHFATAATLMLRALGVPARFTVGYMITIPPDQVGEVVVITDREAHAWVEVFYDNVGWLPLEVTPASSGSGIYVGLPQFSPSMLPDGQLVSSSSEWDPMLDDPYYGMEVEGGSADDAPQGGDDEYDYRLIAIIPLSLLAIVLLLILRGYISQFKRDRAFANKDTNLAVIHAWRYILRLRGRVLPRNDEVKLTIGREGADFYEELAQKARFSQHRLTESEREAMIEYAKQMAKEKKDRANFIVRFWINNIKGL